MTEKRNKSFVSHMIWSAVMLIIAGTILLGMNIMQNPETLYANGTIFGKAEQRDGSLQAVQITGFESQRLGTVPDAGTAIYLIRYQTDSAKTQYVGLELRASDPLIQELSAKGNTLLENPVLIAATVRRSGSENSIEDYTLNLRYVLSDNPEILRETETVYYVSHDDANSSKIVFYIAAGFFAVCSIFMFVRGFVWRKQSNQAYDELYATYPELKENFDLIREDATYKDDALQIILYKNHLITTSKKFSTYDLRQAERIYHYQFSQKRYGMTVSRTSQLILLTENSSYRKKKLGLYIENIGEGTDDQLQPFFFALSQEFPALKIGYENKKRPF